MDHIKVFATVVNLVLSILALITTRSLFSANRHPLRRFLLLLVTAHIVYDLRSFILFYVTVNIEPLASAPSMGGQFILWLFPELITWGRRACILMISSHLIGRRLPYRLWEVLLGLGILLLGFWTFWMFLPDLEIYSDSADILYRMGLQAVELTAMGVVLHHARQERVKSKKAALGSFSLLALAQAAFYLLFLLFGTPPSSRLSLRLIFDFLFRISINAWLLVWLWHWLRPCLADERKAANVAERTAQIGDLGLTPREMEIMQLILQGLGNQTISDRLFISEHTVKNAITSIYAKARVKNRKELFSRFLDS